MADFQHLANTRADHNRTAHFVLLLDVTIMFLVLQRAGCTVTSVVHGGNVMFTVHSMVTVVVVDSSQTDRCMRRGIRVSE
jgi:hypothetical protein